MFTGKIFAGFSYPTENRAAAAALLEYYIPYKSDTISGLEMISHLKTPSDVISTLKMDPDLDPYLHENMLSAAHCWQIIDLVMDIGYSQ